MVQTVDNKSPGKDKSGWCEQQPGTGVGVGGSWAAHAFPRRDIPPDIIMHLPKTEQTFPMECPKVLREVGRTFKCCKCDLATVKHKVTVLF